MLWLQLVLTLLPSAIKAAELAIGAGKGADKRELAIALISTGAEAAGEAGTALGNKQLSAVGQLVDITVGALNNSGVFTTLVPRTPSARPAAVGGTR